MSKRNVSDKQNGHKNGTVIGLAREDDTFYILRGGGPKCPCHDNIKKIVRQAEERKIVNHMFIKMQQKDALQEVNIMGDGRWTVYFDLKRVGVVVGCYGNE